MFFSLSYSKKFQRQRYLKLVALLLIIFFLEWLGLVQLVKNSLNFVFEPVLKFNVQIAHQVVQPVVQLRDFRHAAYKIQSLEQQLAAAEVEVAQLRQLQQENQALRDLIENTDRQLVDTYISRPILSLAQPAVSLPVDENKDFHLPAAVLVDQTLVGVATNRQENLALVKLLWQKSNTAILAKTESGVEGLIKGDGRKILLTEIPMEAELTIGEQVVSIGQQGVAGNLYIGKIRAIESGQEQAVKQAVVEQQVSFYDAVVVELR